MDDKCAVGASLMSYSRKEEVDNITITTRHNNLSMLVTKPKGAHSNGHNQSSSP